MNKTLLSKIWPAALSALLLIAAPSIHAADVLHPAQFKSYTDRCNADDSESTPGTFPNTRAWEFLSANIPLFECPDKELERTYYFRGWTFRKHIKQTPVGFIVDEFLPNVPWAGKYNSQSP